MATITSHYARAALNGVRRQRRDIGPLLDAAGISKELFAAKESRVHAEQMTRLIQAIWKTLDDEFMGCTPTPCKQGSFGMMCQLVSYCNTVDAMFEQGIKFYQLITDDIQMQYRHVGDRREFVVTMTDANCDGENFYLEFWLVIWHRLVSWMIGKKIKIQAVYFTYPEPAHSTEFKYQFSCPCYFEAAETKLCFSQQYASLPPVRTQRELAQFLKRSPADLMTIPGDDGSLSLIIKTRLLDDVEKLQPFPEFDALSTAMHLSPQTLRRRLKEEGASYQKIKDAIRCDIAIEKISVQQMAVNDVAELLNFSEPRSFTRAFKQWTGVTPSAYRRNFEIDS